MRHGRRVKSAGGEQRGRLTRRSFIADGSKLGAGIALGPLVLELAACSGDGEGSEGGRAGVGDPASAPGTGDAGRADGSVPSANAEAIDSGAVLLGLYVGDGASALQRAAARLDFSWLGAGDSVLIKVASNSGHPHPAVSSPNAVRAMAAHLKSLGAGRVLVADQAGVEHVRSSALGRFSSTRERFMTNELITVESEAELHFFDDQGFADGYFEATLPEGNRWPRGLYLGNALAEVDHIIYMPRIAAHMLAGLTLGHKSAIGFLRDDSRHDLHNDALDFYEKYAEISYTQEIRERFRMAVTVAEKVLLHGGPDLGTVFAMSPVLVVASTRLANHDALASSLLVTLNAQVPNETGGMDYNSGFASFANRAFAGGVQVATGDAGAWMSGAPSSLYAAHGFEQGVTRERAIARGWELSGGRPERIAVVLDGETIDAELRGGVETHGEGLYGFG